MQVLYTKDFFINRTLQASSRSSLTNFIIESTRLSHSSQRTKSLFRLNLKQSLQPNNTKLMRLRAMKVLSKLISTPSLKVLKVVETMSLTMSKLLVMMR
ncbi:hypothetical protein Fmac_025185 [Flemingia macrophylla]|uniref:Uncharacterized protein n=1 Tax=Flemingia macrophylla TaxID=520843 RepID=A0ABD1LRH6_9FABA